jgi:hypothetical protein
MSVSDASADVLQEPFPAASQDLRSRQVHPLNYRPDRPDIQDEDAGRSAYDCFPELAEAQDR